MKLAVLALGRYGISEARVMCMTRPELDGWLDAIAGITGAPSPAADTTITYIPQRRKKA